MSVPAYKTILCMSYAAFKSCWKYCNYKEGTHKWHHKTLFQSGNSYFSMCPDFPSWASVSKQSHGSPQYECDVWRQIMHVRQTFFLLIVVVVMIHKRNKTKRSFLSMFILPNRNKLQHKPCHYDHLQSQIQTSA